MRNLFSVVTVATVFLVASDIAFAQQTGTNTGTTNTGTANTGTTVGNATSATADARGALNVGDGTAGQATISGQAGSILQQNNNSGQGGGGGGQTRQFGGAGGGRGGNTGRNVNNSRVQSARRVIRPVVRVAFAYPRITGFANRSLNKQFDRVSLRLNNRFRNLGIKVNDKGIASLDGRVVSENDRKLAAAYARLEPGVRKIENNLVVSGGSGSSGSIQNRSNQGRMNRGGSRTAPSNNQQPNLQPPAPILRTR